VDAGGPVPGELQLAWWCTDGRLPDAGGVLDQDYALQVRLTAAGNVHRTLGRYRGLRGAQIHSLSGSERKLLGYLQRQGML
jgi:hypothetical protein